MLPQRHRQALRKRASQFGMADEKSLDTDVAGVKEDRDRSNGQIQSLQRRLEVNQPIPSRNFKQSIAQMSLDQPALSRQARFPESLQSIECESCLLVPVVLQPPNDRGQILRAPVPVQFR